MFTSCQTEDDLNLAYLEVLIALNDGVDVDDSVELDRILKAKCPQQYAAVNAQYDNRRDEMNCWSALKL
jgi:hypothetical protein